MPRVPALLFFVLIFVFTPQIFAAHRVTSLPEVRTYDELVHAIRETRAAAQTRVEEAVEREKVREAWEIGKLIDTHVLHHKERADYGEQVLLKLAKDLKTSETELRFMLQFARTYSIHPPADELSWAHYRELLSLNEPKEREEVTREAVREGWTRDRVREEVRRRQAARKPSQETLPELRLSATPGKIGVYRVIRAKVGPFAGELALDLGFASYFQPKGIQKFKEGELVQLEKGKLRSFKGSNGSRYTYLAYVSEVIDGDTLKAVVDLGFKIVAEQKLRLRGLDAPEIESAEGKEAKAFLESVIARPVKRGEAISRPVLIKTSKSDKYDRYLVDVFIPKKGVALSEAKDPGSFIYLNQTLLDKRLALRVSD